MKVNTRLSLTPTEGTLRLKEFSSLRLSRSLITVVLCASFLGCHRSEFGEAQSTTCPEPEGALVVLDYTINCLYVGDTPEMGCPEAFPNSYFYRETYICSERTGAQNAYLNQLVDLLLDVDAAIPLDLSATGDAASDASLTSGPSVMMSADTGVTDTEQTPEPEPEPEQTPEPAPEPEADPTN
jgi:hypothetical protein